MKYLIIIILSITAVSVYAQQNTNINNSVVTDFTISIPSTGEITISNQENNLINEYKPLVVMEVIEESDAIHFFISEDLKSENNSGTFFKLNSETDRIAELVL